MTARALGHTYVPGLDGAAATVTLTVRHLDTDSYSRSVDRAAMAWARQCRNYPGTWSLTDARYGVRSVDTGGPGSNGRPWTESEIVFRVTT